LVKEMKDALLFDDGAVKGVNPDLGVSTDKLLA
jgi:hypothetical protein